MVVDKRNPSTGNTCRVFCSEIFVFFLRGCVIRLYEVIFGQRAISKAFKAYILILCPEPFFQELHTAIQRDSL